MNNKCATINDSVINIQDIIECDFREGHIIILKRFECIL